MIRLVTWPRLVLAAGLFTWHSAAEIFPLTFTLEAKITGSEENDHGSINIHLFHCPNCTSFIDDEHLSSQQASFIIHPLCPFRCTHNLQRRPEVREICTDRIYSRATHFIYHWLILRWARVASKAGTEVIAWTQLHIVKRRLTTKLITNSAGRKTCWFIKPCLLYIHEHILESCMCYKQH